MPPSFKVSGGAFTEPRHSLNTPERCLFITRFSLKSATCDEPGLNEGGRSRNLHFIQVRLSCLAFQQLLSCSPSSLVLLNFQFSLIQLWRAGSIWVCLWNEKKKGEKVNTERNFVSSRQLVLPPSPFSLPCLPSIFLSLSLTSLLLLPPILSVSDFQLSPH